MSIGYQRRVQQRGPLAHRVAVLTLVVWSAAALLSVHPANLAVHASGAAALADPAPRPGLDALILGAAPLAYWPLQDNSTTTVRDRIALHDATGAGRLQTGQVGPGTTVTSFGFDGTTSQLTAPATGLAPLAISATAWLRSPRARTSGVATVVSTGGLDLSIYRGRVFGVTCTSSASCSSVSSTMTVTDGAWHQIALSVSSATAVLYVDGRRVATAATGGSSAVPADGLVHIGRGFRGNLDDVALFAAPLSEAAVSSQFSSGACPQAAGTLPPATYTRVTMPALPLHTSGRWIVDATGKRVKLAGVNWYGAESLDRVPGGLQCQSVDAVAAHLVASGFNVVRLPWSTDSWVGPVAPTVPTIALAANPQLRGANARQVFDAVIASLGRHGLMVILDNHVGRADWCCSPIDGNALWWEDYDPSHPPRWAARTPSGKLRFFNAGQARWLSAWRHIVTRYSPGGSHPQANIVGADLRNEPRSDTRLRLSLTWRAGKVEPWLDWPRAAERAGNLVLAVNRRLLVVVEGSNWGTDLRGVGLRPARLQVAHRLVYSAHDYSWDHSSPAHVGTDLGAKWGWLLIQHRWWTTPVFVGEYGSCHPDESGCNESAWFAAFRQYLANADLDWTYWSVNGTGSSGAADPTTCAATPRATGCIEPYGVTDPAWAGDASPALSADLRALEPQTQSP